MHSASAAVWRSACKLVLLSEVERVQLCGAPLTCYRNVNIRVWRRPRAARSCTALFPRLGSPSFTLAFHFFFVAFRCVAWASLASWHGLPRHTVPPDLCPNVDSDAMSPQRLVICVCLLEVCGGVKCRVTVPRSRLCAVAAAAAAAGDVCKQGQSPLQVTCRD